MQKLLNICEAIHSVTGRRPNLSTGWRWSTKGCRGIRLRTAVLGGKMLTTIAWVEEFIQATTEARNANYVSPVATSSTTRDKQIAKASADLHAKLNKPKRAKAKA